MKTILKKNSDFLASEVTVDCVNQEFEGRMVRLFVDLFNPIAYMSPEVMHHNFELLSGTVGSTIEDRKIPMPLADYLLEHASTFYMGLITNDIFRNAVLEAVVIEMALEEKNEEFVQEVRYSMMHINEQYADEIGAYTIDSSRFDKSRFDWFINRLAESFQRTEDFEDAENEMISGLLDEERINNGYIISNFAYLLRAFAKNQVFAHYVRIVIDGVEQKLEIA